MYIYTGKIASKSKIFIRFKNKMFVISNIELYLDYHTICKLSVTSYSYVNVFTVIYVASSFHFS